MSVEHEDPRVEELLTGQGARWRASFTPPPVEGMLAVAMQDRPRPGRWVWPVAAAVLLLVVPLVTLLVLDRQPHAQPAGPSRSGTPIGRADWRNAVTKGNTVTVFATYQSPKLCSGAPPVARAKVLTESTTTVAIQFVFYTAPDAHAPHLICGTGMTPEMAQVSLPATVTLQRPLGTRTLLDDTGAVQHSIDDTVMPVPGYLPAGYHFSALVWNQVPKPAPNRGSQGGPPGLYLARTYNGPGDSLDIDRRPHDEGIWPPAAFIKGHGTVLGHPAVYRTIVDHEVIWQDGDYDWMVREVPQYLGKPGDIATGSRFLLSQADLFKIANSLHNTR